MTDDLAPAVVDRRLRDLGRDLRSGRSLKSARFIESDASKIVDDASRYATAMTAFHEHDYASAFPGLLKCAQDGHADAQCVIGNCFQAGLGRSIDLAEAEAWYMLAAGQGHSVAINNLGTLCLARGDQEGARAWYEKAREHGFLHSPVL